jgi:ADP-ribose pyrophosphatase YjhB (NUDIX family)
MIPKWLHWAQKLEAIAQSGLTYAPNEYEIERYKQVREIAAEMMASQSGIDSELIASYFAHGAGYETPKVDVRGVVFRDDGILLVRELADHGLYTLPGGWADVGDSPSEAVVREVWEESGFRVRAVKLLALLDRNKHPHPPHIHHIYKVFVRCEITGGEARDSNETSGAAFFREDEILELSEGRVTRAQIARLFEHYRNPGLPTDFD